MFKHPSIPKYHASAYGIVYNSRGVKVNSSPVNGYLKFSVRINGRPTKYPVHKFVWEAYHDEDADDLHKIIHFDGNKLNNRVYNLKQVFHESSNPYRKERKLLSTDLDTGKQRKFDSIYQVSKATGINPGSIKLIADGKRKTATTKVTNHKLTFKYANPNDLDVVKYLQERIRKRMINNTTK